MKKGGNYFICEYTGHAAIAGPYVRASVAARLVDAQPEPKDYCVMSRYALAKTQRYPLNKDGNEKLQSDLIEAAEDFDMDDLLYDDDD